MYDFREWQYFNFNVIDDDGEWVILWDTVLFTVAYLFLNKIINYIIQVIQ